MSSTGWCGGDASMNHVAMLLAQLRALCADAETTEPDGSYRTPLRLAGGEAHVELQPRGDNVRLHAIVPPFGPGPSMAACLRMLDANLFATCAGGMFAVDEYGVTHLVRDVPCSAEIDAHFLYDVLARFTAEAREFLDELFTSPRAADAQGNT
jgi:hypothetical protein